MRVPCGPASRQNLRIVVTDNPVLRVLQSDKPPTQASFGLTTIQGQPHDPPRLGRLPRTDHDAQPVLDDRIGLLPTTENRSYRSPDY